MDVPGFEVVAQKAEIPPQDGDRADAPVYTYWVSARDGTGAFVGETTVGGEAVGPVTHVTSTRIFSAVPVPFPKVNVYDVTGVEWTLGETGGV